ncbi:DUF502 domain-containing protein [Calothrix sp. UHCC 0171]|uniref:DUF502 domain-containing protein n=1 Tax=Calothrix sp. UHCC 0171 TaxID=3110245 RepID=UPI002B1F9CA0|nr:DUF502 domain-containing protein [Calothrix sp. UHCC 0171]MEA5569488.1 DUF502 domain-containing protein [Calothrix sp. UHCC 0171]
MGNKKNSTSSIEESQGLVIDRLKQDLKNDLIAGLLVVIPLATTIWLTITIANWVINFLTQVPKQLNPFDGLHPILVNILNLLVGLAVPLVSILAIGLMARNIAGRWLLDFGEKFLQAIPLAGQVYKTLKQLLETILKDSNGKFRRVILIEYPRRGIWAIAFVTGVISNDIQSQMSRPMLSVFIPTTPNPTTGWYAVIPEDEVINLSISIEDAFKIVVSGGIVAPNSQLPQLVMAKERKVEIPLAEIQLTETKRKTIPVEET